MGERRVRRSPRWSGWAWAAIALVAAFIAITCWWTSQDRGVPFADAGSHLYTVIAYHDLLSNHVFMIDAPLAAVVAASVWLILLSDRFRRVGVAAAAGAAVGFGLASKEQFPLFVAGLLLVVLLRQRGWRNWRGIAAFAGVAAVVAAPWNAEHIPPRGRPPLVSLANLGWYFWATLNGLLFAPLFAFATVGVVRAARVVSRHDRGEEDERGLRAYGPELLAGTAAGWLGISFTPHHDMRYALPLLVYLSVLGTSWIPLLRERERRPRGRRRGDDARRDLWRRRQSPHPPGRCAGRGADELGHSVARPCVRLSDGTGIWFVVGDPDAGDPVYCPIARRRS